MIVQLIQGDITETPGADIILHQANIHNVMGAGVASALIRRWPGVLEADRIAWEAHFSEFERSQYRRHPALQLLGHYSKYVSANKSDPITVYNVYAQRLDVDSPAGCRTSYDQVVAALTRINHDIKHAWGGREKFPVVAVPRGMGCGLAGGNWQIYQAILEAMLADAVGTLLIVQFSTPAIKGTVSTEVNQEF